MADTIKIGNLDISAFKVGSSDCKIYLGDILLYPQSTPPTPVSSCYEVIPQPISQYTSTTYDSVYSLSDAKWYMKNNLNHYEEYGIYDIVENISSATTYDGKLAVVGTTEYQYSGGSWVVVGTYEDVYVTYTIDGTNPSPYVGQELATTFKIPTADIEALGGSFDFYIDTQDGVRLYIMTDVYRYSGSQSYVGTVTNDSEYYYFALPSEAPQSIIIDSIDYWDSTPIHLISSSKQASVEYSAKTIPSSALTYSSVEEMEAASCPTVGVGQYCYTNGQAYKYSSNEEWTTVQDSDIFVKQFYDDGRVGVLPCVYSDTLNVGVLGNKSGTLPYTDPTIEVYVGDCVLHLGDDAFYGLKNMTSCRLPNNIDKIPSRCFYDCFSITSITIPYSVTEISYDAFYSCYSLKNISIPSNVTSIGHRALRNCSGLTSITVEATTPPTLGKDSVFDGTNNCPIYVPSQSVDAYKSATNWSTYASRIQAILEPTLQWVSINSGDTIPKGNIYGIKISSQNAGRDFGNGFEIGTDSDNCAWFGGGKPTRAPQFTAYFYTITNGVSTLENSWDNGDKEFIFSNYSGANYYYEDGTKTAPYAIQLYMYA